MDATTAAIVLRKTPYTGSSAIVATYSESYGQMAFMVRGLGKKGGKNAALQPLSRVEIICQYRQSKSLQTAQSIRLVSPASAGYQGPVKASISLFLAEVLYKALREESPDLELYEYLDNALAYFEESPPNSVFHLQLMAKLTRFLGFFPAGSPGEERPYFDLQNGIFTANLNDSLHVLPRAETAVFYRLATADFQSEIHLDRMIKRDILTALTNYYRLHLEGFGELKSLPVLMELFG